MLHANIIYSHTRLEGQGWALDQTFSGDRPVRIGAYYHIVTTTSKYSNKNMPRQQRSAGALIRAAAANAKFHRAKCRDLVSPQGLGDLVRLGLRLEVLCSARVRVGKKENAWPLGPYCEGEKLKQPCMREAKKTRWNKGSGSLSQVPWLVIGHDPRDVLSSVGEAAAASMSSLPLQADGARQHRFSLPSLYRSKAHLGIHGSSFSRTREQRLAACDACGALGCASIPCVRFRIRIMPDMVVATCFLLL
jgi:hypothetical protein